MLEFWEDARDWLLARGVRLYRIGPKSNKDSTKVWHAPSVTTHAPLPFARAVWDDAPVEDIWTGVSAARSLSIPTDSELQSRLACGQDMLGRDIMLKLVDKGSSQYRIFQTLKQHEELFSDPNTFPGVLPPLAIIDTPHHYSIVTMPM